MDYSVYILGGDDANDRGILQGLQGDVNKKTMAADALFAAIENLSGVSFHDRYAMMLKDKQSVALTGGVVTDLTYNTQIKFHTKFQNDGDYVTDVFKKTLFHTLTVKGNLDASSAFFGIPALKELLKKKDPSRIWAWANAPFPREGLDMLDLFDINDVQTNYYRTVVAQVYSDSQSVFRELLLKNANVASYDEYYDENGNGHFTLVVSKEVTLPDDAAHPDIDMTGPTFNRTFTSMAGDISKAVKTVKKDVDKGLDVAEKLGADKDHIEAVRNVTKTGGKMLESTNTFTDGGLNFDAENIVDQVEDQKDNVETGMGRDVVDESTSTEYKKIKNKEDHTETEVEITTHKDGTKTAVKTTKDKEGNVIKVETEEYEW